MTKYIKIELLSPLCASTGETIGSLIDTDCCFDEKGFPFIPGRRLKGLLLDGYLDYLDISGETNSNVNKWFGKEDNDHPVIIVSDALLENYEGLKQEAEKAGSSYEAIKSLYSNPVTRTAIENTPEDQIKRNDENDKSHYGIAKRNSLRTTNVVNKDCVFAFDINCPEDFPLDKILPLVKHMGLNRNVGYGYIKMSEDTNTSLKETNNPLSIPEIGDDIISVNVLLRNDKDLMCGNLSNSESLDYIPGSNILGTFAYAYMKKNKLAEPLKDSEFLRLFTNGGIKFSNAYVSDEEGTKYDYAYSFYGTPKENKESAVFLPEPSQEKDNEQKDNVKIKPLKNCYTCFDKENPDTINKKDVDEHYVEHISYYDKNSFYELFSITRNQYFSFTLTGKAKDINTLLTLNDEGLMVGKSRTAQYGAISLLKADIEHSSTVNGSKIIVFLSSPVVIEDEETRNCKIENQDLIGLLSDFLGLSKPNDNKYTIKLGQYSGFNIKWKLPKPTITAFERGSYLVFDNPEKKTFNEYYTIGSYTNEGYGLIHLFNYESAQKYIKINPKEITNSKPMTKQVTDNNLAETISKDNAINIIIRKAINVDIGASQFTSSFVHRLLNSLIKSDSYEQFQTEINKIANSEKQKAAQGLITNFESDCLELNPNAGLKEFNELYFDYFHYLFVRLKVQAKESDGENND